MLDVRSSGVDSRQGRWGRSARRLLLLAAPLLMGACAGAWGRLNAIPDCPGGTELAQTQHRRGLGCYRNDVPDGPFVFFDEQGNVSARAEFKKGKMDGRVTAYYPDGHVKFVTEMRAGKMEGRLVVYRDDGSIRKIATNLHGVLEGPYEERRADGSPVMRGQFSHGLKQGKWTYWSARGAKPQTFEYDRGHAVTPLLEIQRLPDDAGTPDAGHASAASDAGAANDAGSASDAGADAAPDAGDAAP